MNATEILKRLESIRCWLAPNEDCVNVAKGELESLIGDIAREGLKEEPHV